MSSDPSDFNRERRSGRTKIYVQYRGSCQSCGRTVQATPIRISTRKHQHAWVRCRNCGRTCRCTQTGSEER